MVDFRFHIVSIVAVFLALGLGVLMGSGLGDDLTRRIERQVEDVNETNNQLLAAKSKLESIRQEEEGFIEALTPQLLGNSLNGRALVVIEIDPVPEEMRDGVTERIEEAGGRIATTVTLTQRLALDSEIEVEQLALILRSSNDTKSELLAELGNTLGQRLGSAERFGTAQGPGQNQPLELLLTELSEADFVTVTRTEESVVPNNDSFLILGGGSTEPAYDADVLVLSIAEGLTSEDERVMVGESSDSRWGLVRGIRNDDVARQIISTADWADTVAGQLQLVLGLSAELEKAAEEPAGHYGTGAGADLLPAPNSDL